jgi:uncharacterized protein (DUF2252 family)
VPELVPLRHARMLVSPFTFCRGAALPMVADLSRSPSSGLRVQLCGDAHLSNFGIFGAPDRRLVFDINDFDETLPVPFEWDVKRLGASFSLAGRDNGLTAGQRRKVVIAGAERYRTAMREFADMSVLAVWYARLDAEDVLKQLGDELTSKQRKDTKKALTKARARDSRQALSKLTTVVDGQLRIISDPPLIVPVEELTDETDVAKLDAWLGELADRYAESLTSDRQHLLRQFDLTRVARKFVGVGSVGTRAWILLFDSGDGQEPLLLQVKEAQASVLAAYCGDSEYQNQGQRVVAGQHLLQAASDIFLGWQRSTGIDGADRAFTSASCGTGSTHRPSNDLAPTSWRSSRGSVAGPSPALTHGRGPDRPAAATTRTVPTTGATAASTPARSPASGPDLGLDIQPVRRRRRTSGDEHRDVDQVLGHGFSLNGSVDGSEMHVPPVGARLWLPRTYGPGCRPSSRSLGECSDRGNLTLQASRRRCALLTGQLTRARTLFDRCTRRGGAEGRAPSAPKLAC